jgi:hypothetical protein
VKKAVATAFDDGKKYGFGSKYNFKDGEDYYEKNKTSEVFTLPPPPVEQKLNQ